MKKVYLAGPDVFYPDALQRAEKHKKLCLAHGFQPLHPADGEQSTAQDIYTANIAMINQADAVLANLTPFRGAETDSGTAFEIGYAIALGKTVIGYMDKATSVRDQVQKFYGPIFFDEEREQWLDQNECLIEDFSLPVNLMIGISTPIVYGDILTAILHLQRQWFD